MNHQDKMKIEIWSDIACPFCFIGKHQLEKVLTKFPHAEFIEISWRTFILDPTISADSQQSLYSYLATVKGIEIEQVKKLTQHINQRANDVGLKFDFDHSIVANTLNAHRLSHLAKTKGAELQNKAEELLFTAYFIESKDINNLDVLVEIGTKLGFDQLEVEDVIQKKKFTKDIEADGQEAIALGINVVPYFLFNKQLAISGVQTEDKILETLETAYQQWKNKITTKDTTTIKGSSCSLDGHCE